jgi:hypothetical protein
MIRCKDTETISDNPGTGQKEGSNINAVFILKAFYAFKLMNKPNKTLQNTLRYQSKNSHKSIDLQGLKMQVAYPEPVHIRVNIRNQKKITYCISNKYNFHLFAVSIHFCLFFVI